MPVGEAMLALPRTRGRGPLHRHVVDVDGRVREDADLHGKEPVDYICGHAEPL